MASRAKPKEIVVEAQKPFDVAKKVGAWVGFPLAIITIVILIVMSVDDGKVVRATQATALASSIPLASSPQSSWPKLVIPPGGKSERVAVPIRMHGVMVGEDFHFVCVYKEDDHEVSVGRGEPPCPGGNMPFVYAKNDRVNETNIISYAFAPD